MGSWFTHSFPSVHPSFCEDCDTKVTLWQQKRWLWFSGSHELFIIVELFIFGALKSTHRLDHLSSMILVARRCARGISEPDLAEKTWCARVALGHPEISSAEFAALTTLLRCWLQASWMVRSSSRCKHGACGITEIIHGTILQLAQGSVPESGIHRTEDRWVGTRSAKKRMSEHRKCQCVSMTIMYHRKHCHTTIQFTQTRFVTKTVVVTMDLAHWHTQNSL